MKTVHILSTSQPTETKALFVNLPDQPAFDLIASLADRAKKANRPFRILPLDRNKHPRGYCVGQTSSALPVGVFYISAYGDYAWIETRRLVVVPELGQSRLWISKPIENGMIYWFQLASPLLPPETIKAVPVGMVGPLADTYHAQHPDRPQEPPKAKKENSQSGDLTEFNHPPPTGPLEPAFIPLKSLDELGL